MKFILISFLVFGTFSLHAGLPVREIEAGTVSASSGWEEFHPAHALDSDPETRWSSNFDDGEWWQIEFADRREVAGLSIEWETAFAEQYLIQVSNNGRQWKTVYAEMEGDGGQDLIYLKPVKTRYLRIQGVKRATGWGYSMYEVYVFDSDRLPVSPDDSSRQNKELVKVLDGQPDTEWQGYLKGNNTLELMWKTPLELGGLVLDWGGRFAREYTVLSIDEDGAEQVLYQERHGNGGRDYVYFAPTVVQQLHIRCQEGNHTQTVLLKDIRFKTGSEAASPLVLYTSKARDLGSGLYPFWLTRKQEYWTVTGLPESPHESLLGESGIVEPYQRSFTVLPLVREREKWVTWRDVNVRQSLIDDELPLPSVHWRTPAWSMDISMVTTERDGREVTWVRYAFSNQSRYPFDGTLGLAIHPIQLNPTWQKGGFSPIHSIASLDHEQHTAIACNGRTSLVVYEPAARLRASSLQDGNPLFPDEDLPANAEDAEGKVSGLVEVPLVLEPGEKKEVVVMFPLGDSGEIADLSQEPSDEFAEVQQQEADRWKELLDTVEIDIPEERLVKVLKSNLAYILINQDGPWIKPGPRNYNHSWLRDGAMTSTALLRMGIQEPVRRYVDAFLPEVHDSGWVPWIVFEDGHSVGFAHNTREGHEYDSQGQLAFLMRQYLDFTKDTDRVIPWFDTIRQSLAFGQALRSERMGEVYQKDKEKQPYYGILPESNSHEGYFPAMHSYWDNFWYLRGLKDLAAISENLNRPDHAHWAQDELSAARKDLLQSIRRVVKRDDLSFLPGCVEKGDFDATSVAVALMIADETGHLPQRLTEQTFDQYYDHFLSRLKPGNTAAFTPYEVRNADAFLRLGERDRALKLLRHFVHRSARPHAWNHWAEVVHADPRKPSYIGDMPHTWVGSGYVNALRNCFVFEKGNHLILAAGISEDWMKEGVSVRNLPTPFGPVSYSIQLRGSAVICEYAGEAEPPGGIVWAVPTKFSNRKIITKGDVAQTVTYDIYHWLRTEGRSGLMAQRP